MGFIWSDRGEANHERDEKGETELGSANPLESADWGLARSDTEDEPGPGTSGIFSKRRRYPGKRLLMFFGEPVGVRNSHKMVRAPGRKR